MFHVIIQNVRSNRGAGLTAAGKSPVYRQRRTTWHASAVSDQWLGSVVRAVRIRRGSRQLDLAVRAGVSQSAVSRIERGHLETVTLDTIRSVAGALDIRVDIIPRWRAGDLDRLMNAGHAALHEAVARHLGTLAGWEFAPEVSFAIYRERGVIDILAFHRPTGSLLVIELKTDLADLSELVGTLDRKQRLAGQIAAERGWVVRGRPSVWLVVADGHTNRHRVATFGAMLRAAYPLDGRSIGRWLQNPVGSIACLSFWPNSREVTTKPGVAAVRPARRRVRPRSTHAPRGRRDVREAGPV